MNYFEEEPRTFNLKVPGSRPGRPTSRPTGIGPTIRLERSRSWIPTVAIFSRWRKIRLRLLG